MSQFRVLVVESDPHFAEVIKNALEAITDGQQASYRTSAMESGVLEVEIVADGNQALQISKTNPPNLILLCVELPKMSGYSICNKLKKNPELKTIPLIIMSSEATPDIFEQHMKLKTRAEDYLIKPFPMEELQDKVTSLLGISASADFADVTSPDGLQGTMPDELINDDTTSSGAVRFEVANLQGAGGDIEIADDEVEVADDYLVSSGDAPVVDNEINQATDLAFAALEIPGEEAPPAPADEIMIDSSSLGTDDNAGYAQSQPLHLPEEPLSDIGEVVEPAEGGLGQETSSGVYTPVPGAYSEPDAPTRFEPMMQEIATSAPVEEPSPYQDAPTRFEPVSFPSEGDISGAPPLVPPSLEEPIDIPAPEVLDVPEAPLEPEPPEEIAAPMLEEPAPLVAEAAPEETGAQMGDLPSDTMQHDAFVEQQRQAELAAESAVPAPTDKRLQRELKEMERENRRLNDELQNALARTSEASATFSHDREMLGLREVINKKEKEILDLKDDLDSKERQILDHKDKVRELERKVRDMDEKLLGIEREMMTVNERCQALNEDKEKMVVRERGVKERLEQAKQEIDKAYNENDLLKNKQAEAMAQLEAEKAAAVSQLEVEAAALKDQHLGEVQRLKDDQARELEERQAAQEEALSRQAEEHALAVDQQREEHERARAQAEEAHANALAGAEQAHRDEVSAINGRHQEEKDTISATHERELNQLQAESEQALEAERNTLTGEREAAVAALMEEHQAELERLRQEHAEAQSIQAERHRQELEQRDADHAGEKESLRTEHKNELDGLKEEHESEIAGLKRSHEERLEEQEQRQKDRVAGMEARHQSEKEAAESERQQEKQELEGQVADRDQRLQDTEEKLRSTEQNLEQSVDRGNQLEQDLSSAKGKIGELDGQVAELEQQSEGYRNQIAQAINKIRSDEQLADKAKRAMAIAVTLLEEQKNVSHELESES